MSVTDARQNSGLDESDAHEEAMTRDTVEQREYSRPRAFSIGPAIRLVRGGMFGKLTDGFTGYYTEA